MGYYVVHDDDGELLVRAASVLKSRGRRELALVDEWNWPQPPPPPSPPKPWPSWPLVLAGASQFGHGSGGVTTNSIAPRTAPAHQRERDAERARSGAGGWICVGGLVGCGRNCSLGALVYQTTEIKYYRIEKLVRG